MYQPLNVSEREIRVLEILPSNSAKLDVRGDPKLEVRLRYCSLNTPISFEALSYTWGPVNDKRFIRVDATDDVPVRPNLEKALRDLRYPETSRLIWIDALCINQADINERREQVQLMRSIYSSASVVRTWIDLDLDLTNTAISQLQTFSDNTAAGDLGGESSFWAPVRPILANEYWDRSWVQQEIAHAADWTIQCHSSVISSRGLAIFAILLVMKEWGFFTNPLADKAGWKALMPHPLRPLLYRSRKESGTVSSSTFYGPLHRALRDCRKLKATDPKDKVFAMLGMIDNYEEGDIDVRYDFTVEQIYMKVAKLSIEKFCSLDFLREATLGNRADEHMCFPSWLPDWSVDSTMEQLTSPSFSIDDLYADTKGLKTPPASLSDLFLIARGCRIGFVSALLTEAQEEGLWFGQIHIPSLVAKLRYFHKLIDDIDLPVPDGPIDVDEYYSEYVFRGLTGADGRDTEPRRFQSYSRIFRDILSAVSSENEDVEDHTIIETISAIIDEHQDHFGDIVHYMQESCRGRTLFITEYFGMGLVPEQAKADDEIWYILGCPTPMTLRKENEHYTVVGEAYLNDCMRWRIVEETLQTSEQLPLPDYRVQRLSLQ